MFNPFISGGGKRNLLAIRVNELPTKRKMHLLANLMIREGQCIEEYSPIITKIIKKCIFSPPSVCREP